MNEKINNIARQAGMEDYPIEGVNTLYGVKSIEKFAELLIKECAKVGFESVANGDLVDETILSHFGVK
jgi:hypothetical protein